MSSEILQVSTVHLTDDFCVHREKNAEPDYPPPPPFIPLTSSAISNLPALLHAFYAARLEAGLSISEDEPFDHTHSQMGPLGQITVKLPPAKKKKDDEAEAARKVEEKKPKAKKPSLVGILPFSHVI